MKTVFTLALLAATLTAPLYATAADVSDIKADHGAIHKDNKVIDKYEEHLARNRALKADDKATGNAGGQAADSIAIAGDKTMIGAKKVERHIDQKILDHHTKELNEDATK